MNHKKHAQQQRRTHEPIADEIRRATARNVLHPLVASNAASPRGLCNAHLMHAGGMMFCTRNYGHRRRHVNRNTSWKLPWP